MPKKILIIEDDPTSAKLVEFLLKTNDYEVHVSFDGEDGLKKAGELSPELIVLDIQLPKMDGFTFLRELRVLLGGQIPPVVMLTSRDKMQDICKMEGAIDYFVKPLDTDVFLKKIKEILPPDNV